MKFIATALSKLPEYKMLVDAYQSGNFPVALTGLSGVHKCCFTYTLLLDMQRSAASSGGKARCLYLAGDEVEANRIFDDLTAMGLSVRLYPHRDFCFRDAAGVSHEYERQRLEALVSLQNGDCDCVVACIDAALQYTISPQELEKRALRVANGEEISPDKVVEALVRCGYSREDQIEGQGQFSRRGGIIDFYSPGMPNPVRIEFWGDEIDSLSYFDLATQRRSDSVDIATISPCVEVIADNPLALAKKIEDLAASLRGKTAVKARESLLEEANKLRNGLHLASIDKFISLVYPETATLLDYFPETNSALIFSEGNKLRERARVMLWQWGEDVKTYLSSGTLCKGLDLYCETWDYALIRAQTTPTFFMDTFARGSYEIPIKNLLGVSARQLSLWSGSLDILKDDLAASLSQKRAVVVLAGSEKAAKRVAEDLIQANMPAAYLPSPQTLAKGTVTVTNGVLSAGFEFPGVNFVLISHSKTSSGAGQVKKGRKKSERAKEISSLSDLSPGEYVVHSAHGIGVYEGIHKLEMDGVTKDYIKVRYAKNDTLYVPVTQLDMVAKYIGPREDANLRLSKLGGVEWQKTKARVRSSVKDIAKELIVLYAERMRQPGFAFPEDGDWQRDFEARFPYDETDDQLRCINEIKDDMETARPMDRLLCGDVGFGKTEVALRAVFKCVTAGKQCAFLVPTTILAWQHYQTILQRFEGFPIDVGLLSRFRTQHDQAETIKRLKRGSIDVVVGTHRLISKDVRFKDLGLVVIDEEQRFGVAQKEKLKSVCQNADILTLSATPIPRTLSMAMSGIRDMSVIEEAPHDRQPVQTYVMEYDIGVIAEAIRRELRRGGQVYVLRNDVAAIDRTVSRLQEQLPEARIGYGHGKMAEEELSEVWRRLLEHEIDILVCTTIIETGVDVSNVNTLIIEHADRMGLSQLHQIRGRVGRSSRRAYAYLTYTKNKALSDIAQKRLSAIREFTEFGAGFKIAMRDLEIRGAGNVLGGEQHGHMETVGYDMYIKLLNEAVSLMKGETPTPVENDCLVDLQVQAHIPEKYISSSQLRLEVYRSVAAIKSKADAMEVIDELIDRFGDPPAAVQGLIDIALLRNTALALGIDEIKQQNGAILLYQKQIDMAMVSALVNQLKGRVLLSAGSRPYISIKLLNEAPITVLRNVLEIMMEESQAEKQKT